MPERVTWDQSYEPQVLGPAAHLWTRTDLVSPRPATTLPAWARRRSWPPTSASRTSQLQATGGVVEVQDPEVGNITKLGVPLYLQGTPGAVQGPQSLPGAHTEDILESLGRSPADVEQLRHTREILAELRYDDSAIDALAVNAVVTWPDAIYPFPV